MFTYDYAFVEYIIVVLYDVYHDNVRHGVLDIASSGSVKYR